MGIFGLIICNNIAEQGGALGIGHFELPQASFQAGLGAHPFICISIFIYMQIKLIFM